MVWFLLCVTRQMHARWMLRDRHVLEILLGAVGAVVMCTTMLGRHCAPTYATTQLQSTHYAAVLWVWPCVLVPCRQP